MKKLCRHCRREFTPCPRVKNHQFCGLDDCRRAWKREWQRQKKAADAEYRSNQEAAQKAWRERHTKYWQEYRLRNPVSTERNRLKQRERNHTQRNLPNASVDNEIAKMDSIILQNADSVAIWTGRYCLSPVVDGVIAKMDSIIVEIRTIADVMSDQDVGDP
jgi:hypothetical protein